jgi:5-bromo-4-chloroindolyl phosphate hydrolysis protein
MENTNTVVTVLTEKVEKFKFIARNALRMKLINPRLTNIANLEKVINNKIKENTEKEKEIKVMEYEITKLDTNHPRYQERKEITEKDIKFLKDNIEDEKKYITEIEKLITEQKEGIQKIETGETKVSLDDLNDLTNLLIKEDAKNQVNNQTT